MTAIAELTKMGVDYNALELVFGDDIADYIEDYAVLIDEQFREVYTALARSINCGLVVTSVAHSVTAFSNKGVLFDDELQLLGEEHAKASLVAFLFENPGFTTEHFEVSDMRSQDSLLYKLGKLRN